MPLMTVVNYSVQDILGPDQAVFVGTEWFKEVMRDESLHCEAMTKRSEARSIGRLASGTACCRFQRLCC